MNSVEQYANAIRQSTVAGQIEGMEKYLAVAENGVLKQDALEVLIWDYTRMGSYGHVKQRAQDLLALDGNNPVALAALAEQGAQQPGAAATGKKKHVSAAKETRAKVEKAKSALVVLENLRKPEGMLDGDFAALRRHVEARLDGVLGMTYIEAEDYQDAKTPLQEAVASDPMNAQYAYGLGLALLLAKDNDPARAYWYLARAADLTQGTAESSAISEFARKSYRKAGGNDAGWQKFLNAAAVPPQKQSPTVVASLSSAPSTSSAASSSTTSTPVPGSASAAPANAVTSSSASATPNGAVPNSAVNSNVAPPVTAGVPGNATPAGTPPANASGTSSATASSSPSTTVAGSSAPNSAAPSGNSAAPAATAPQQTASTSVPSSAAEVAAAAPPDVGRQPVTPPMPRPEVITSPNPPVSLGILIETALLTGNNRPAIISTLREMVRHLRPGDEACILVFSNQLDFEQDLTGNDTLLTDAMEGLRPHPGKALLDGVAFAAGHLKRIGKNANRVLLVVSDGRNARGGSQSQALTTQISGVKIDSIGLNVGDSAGRELLQRLAELTGGQTSFVADPAEFRIAAARITNTMGIPMR
ncbi:MAG TPA: tetratricopeptide repeat protein [Candidatus Angelobacter sp.]|nr:tetratricopeptide repeat protein [Candidatus Angelobacter sp.]